MTSPLASRASAVDMEGVEAARSSRSPRTCARRSRGGAQARRGKPSSAADATRADLLSSSLSFSLLLSSSLFVSLIRSSSLFLSLLLSSSLFFSLLLSSSLSFSLLLSSSLFFSLLPSLAPQFSVQRRSALSSRTGDAALVQSATWSAHDGVVRVCIHVTRWCVASCAASLAVPLGGRWRSCRSLRGLVSCFLPASPR